MKWIVLITLMLVSCLITAEEMRDPTQPLFSGGKIKQKSKLVLQAIYTRNGSKKAVINGKTLKKGQSVGGARLVDVTGTSAVLNQDGKKFTLYLRKSIR